MAAMAPLVNEAGPEIVASLRLLPAGLVVLASVPFLKRSWNISKDDLVWFLVFTLIVLLPFQMEVLFTRLVLLLLIYFQAPMLHRQSL